MKPEDFPKRSPIQKALRRVPKLLPAIMPNNLAEIIFDASKRIGCQPDYVYLAVIGYLTSLMSPLIRIYPKAYDESWKVSPNIAGLAVGNSSSKKSAAIEYIKGIVRGVCREEGVENIRFMDSTLPHC